MSRPATISTQNILDAAREVFFARGFRHACTAAIAERAGVSEGSVFKRFATKEELFRAAMDLPRPPVDSILDTVGTGDIRDRLIAVALDGIRFIQQLLPKLMMHWSNRGPAEDLLVAKAPTEVLHTLTRYFKAEMALGRLREGDPQVVARIFMGALWNFCFLQTVAGDRPMTEETYARRLVEQLLTGIGMSGS